MEAQAAAQGQAQQAAAQAEMQKNQQKMQFDSEIENTKAQNKINYLQQEVALKKELMQFEFDLNQKLNAPSMASSESKPPQETSKKFESSGNDILGGGVGLDKFNPQVGN